jgi:hypothetical protein
MPKPPRPDQLLPKAGGTTVDLGTGLEFNNIQSSKPVSGRKWTVKAKKKKKVR